jgi:hypothetical protein
MAIGCSEIRGTYVEHNLFKDLYLFLWNHSEGVVLINIALNKNERY